MQLSYIVSKLLQKIQIPAINNSRIDKSSKVRFNCLVVGCNIKKYTYIAEHTSILYTNIGSFCSIADNCFIGGASHPIEWVSTSPVFHEHTSVIKKKFSKHYYDVFQQTVIGNDVWIASNCLIKSGVKIADGAIIGMGSVLTKDVGPYEIWAGNPAKLIRKRFDDKTIDKLLNIKWWDWKEEKISKYSKFFNNPKVLLRELEK